MASQNLSQNLGFDAGSAGANCWFDAGHSDSMDPMTFRRSALGDERWGKRGERFEGVEGGFLGWRNLFGRLGSMVDI